MLVGDRICQSAIFVVDEAVSPLIGFHLSGFLVGAIVPVIGQLNVISDFLALQSPFLSIISMDEPIKGAVLSLEGGVPQFLNSSGLFELSLSQK